VECLGIPAVNNNELASDVGGCLGGEKSASSED